MGAFVIGLLVGALVAIVLPELIEGFRDDPWEDD